jgi:hypothetical protein
MTSSLLQSVLSLITLSALATLASGQGPQNLGASVKQRGYATNRSVVCEELVLAWGYPCQDHVVITQDGFVLGINRIPGGRSSHQSRLEHTCKLQPVFLMHGILQGRTQALILAAGPRHLAQKFVLVALTQHSHNVKLT